MTEREKNPYNGKASSGETRETGQFNYHYDREERLKGLTFEYPRGKTRGIFRRNKGLTFILLDIFILLLIGFVLVPFMRARFGTESWMGYDLALEAASFDDTVFVQLTVTDDGEGSFPGDRFEAVFIYGNEILGDSFTDFFPDNPSAETSIRTSYPVEAGVGSIEVRVGHADSSVTLKTRIR